jgi:hypothetical protein
VRCPAPRLPRPTRVPAIRVPHPAAARALSRQPGSVKASHHAGPRWLKTAVVTPTTHASAPSMAVGVAILATAAGAVSLTQQVAVQPTLHLAAYRAGLVTASVMALIAADVTHP